MSSSVRFSTSFRCLLRPRIALPEHPSFPQNVSVSRINLLSSFSSYTVCSIGKGTRYRAPNDLRADGSLMELDDDLPISIELQQVWSETQFDRVLTDAQQLEESVIFLWMASWCRKCTYLKSKLEKLAAEYYPRLRFYCVDVNTVPHKLVAHAGVTKMPTIQLWKERKKQGEVIGGHNKAYLIVKEVEQMIDDGTAP